MGKVRDQIPDNEKALAQWAFRKLINHDPMSARSPMVKAGRWKEDPIYAADSETMVLYPLADGRVFLLGVKELNAEEIETQRDALGAHYVDVAAPKSSTKIIKVKKRATAD